MNEPKQVAIIESTAITPLDMLNTAIEKGVDTDQLTKLMELQERWEANEARKAYVKAMAALKSADLSVRKGKHVRFQTSKGVTEYDHATLVDVVDAVVTAMSAHGLSHRWETAQEGGLITVSCVITHELGHSERTTLSANADESGGKNSIQAIGSTVAYLERYTLMAAVGLAARDMDDDGRGAGTKRVTKSQIAHLEKLIADTETDMAKLLETCGVSALDEIEERNFKLVSVALMAKKRTPKEETK